MTSPRRPHRAALLALALGTAAACNGDPEPDAFGTFEGTEVVVSAETGGQLAQFTAEEGAALAAGVVVAVVDTVQLGLERAQVLAQRGAASSRSTEVAEQIQVLEVQRAIAERSYERTRRLHAERAATAQQLDQDEREYRTLLARIRAARAQRESVGMEGASSDARAGRIADQIQRSSVRNPRAGTVLTTYVRAGEVVQPGQPLYRIADLDTLVLRAYVSGGQLAAIRLGQNVEVRVDRGDDLLLLTGTVSWISASAEFTPTPIQTRDDRADLVYAVNISVANRDGALKIGMPGDVTFSPAPVSEEPT